MATTTATLTVSSSDLTSNALTLSVTNTLYKAGTTIGLDQTTGINKKVYAAAHTNATLISAGDFDDNTANAVFIKNTGHVFSSATALGDVEQSRLLKVTTNSGGIILACLDAGEAIVLKGLQATGTIAANGIEVETVNSDGSEAAGGVHLAVEYLVVD